MSTAAYKSALVQSATVAATSSNIFGEEVFELDRIALSLLQSSVSAVTQGTTKQSSPQVRDLCVVVVYPHLSFTVAWTFLYPDLLLSFILFLLNLSLIS